MSAADLVLRLRPKNILGLVLDFLLKHFTLSAIPNGSYDNATE